MKRFLNGLPAGIIAALLCMSTPLVCRAQSAATNLWRLQLPYKDRYADSSPAIGADGTIYQATWRGNLLAVTPQGRLQWTFSINSEIKSSPAIADDGTIYLGARDRKFYAVTPQGTLKWTFPTGAWVDSSPAIGADGTVYFGSWDTNFYALNPDGSKRWVFPAGNIIVSSPAIAADGTIYFGSEDRKFYALNPDGKLRWSFTTGAPIISSPAINSAGVIYFTSTDGNLYALRPDGSELWRLHIGGSSESSPVLDEGGNIYVMVEACWYSYTGDGKKRWYWCGAFDVNDSAAIAANGTVYFPVSWRKLVAVQQNCTELWHVDTDTSILASPVIGNDGTVFFCDGVYLYAVNSTNGPPPAKSSWPMVRADARHTGRVQNAR